MQRVFDRLMQPPHPIGIDLGATGAKLLQLSRSGGGFRVLAMDRVDIASAEDTSPSDDARLDTLIRSIARRVAAGRFTGGRCVVSIDDRLLRTRSVRQPRMPDPETDRAVRLDAPQRLGFPEDAPCEIGWIRAGEVMPADEVKDEVLYFGAESEPLRHLAYGLAQNGLRPLSIEPGFVALARCFGRTLRRASDRSVVRVLADVGRFSTKVVLTRGSEVAFYRHLEMGGAAMTQLAAERLGLTPETVDDLRRQRMSREAGGSCDVDPKVDRALYDAVRPLLGDIAHEINLCLRHYSVTFRGSRPSECLVVGGEALEPRLPEAVQKALNLKTRLGDPLEGIERSTGRDCEGRTAPEWGVAAGLSLQPLDRRSKSARPAARRHIDATSSAGSESDRSARRAA
jgi:type IV pilus assembly protein PilM